jgi:GMP synthase-like glutamine amidotransferase
MRLLLIDNETKHLDALKLLCANHAVDVVKAGDISATDWQEYDGVILSGSYQQAVIVEADSYANEIEIIQSGTVPVLGICFGFELICYAFGAELIQLGDRATGAAKIVPTDDGAKVFQGTDPIRVSEAYRWSVEELPKSLVVLARSETGIEAIRHKTKMVYGLQFHPEDFAYSSDGKLVFDNILSQFNKQKV